MNFWWWVLRCGCVVRAVIGQTPTFGATHCPLRIMVTLNTTKFTSDDANQHQQLANPPPDVNLTNIHNGSFRYGKSICGK